MTTTPQESAPPAPITDVAQIAKVCHEANRAFCETIGDNSQKPWAECEQWQRDSAMEGVVFRINNPGAPASAQHDSWTASKIADGWTYGTVKDAARKTHPCLLAYDELPMDQRLKDHLFMSIVGALYVAE